MVTHPEAITPPYEYFVVFGLGAVLLAAIATFEWRRGRRPIRFLVFVVVWIMVAVYGGAVELSHVRKTRAKARSGTYQSVQGCLESFHPGKPYASKTVNADEVWSVGGERFQYGAGQGIFAWHRVETQGGAIHADSWVAVDFMRDEDDRRNDILRLAVRQHACPRAPDTLQLS
ncbi:hypothetical protein [Novosphingobium terrae]|uniref:hypothetical protein n=1 Tax=Novosphingobium terrae TaxID=2726189 RepID=UPI00197DC3A0|nr:hypothetical protein [Novosphingobium terrae]